jgi:hypothetical protein
LCLSPHAGVIELKELIAMHSSMSSHGGDLKKDTVTIIGATLDLQEKVVEQVCVMIPEFPPILNYLAGNDPHFGCVYAVHWFQA